MWNRARARVEFVNSASRLLGRVRGASIGSAAVGRGARALSVRSVLSSGRCTRTVRQRGTLGGSLRWTVIGHCRHAVVAATVGRSRGGHDRRSRMPRVRSWDRSGSRLRGCCGCDTQHRWAATRCGLRLHLRDFSSTRRRVDVDADHAVLPCGPFLRRALKTIESLYDTDVGESHAPQHFDKLCLRQSTGDSTRPEIDIASHLL